MAWKTKGMNRDLSVSAFNPEFAFENRNLRLSTNNNNTMMSWVNERGTLKLNIVTGEWIPGKRSSMTTVTEIIGTPIGTAVINHQLVVFTTDTLHDLDYIYVLKYADDTKTSMLCKMLFGGEDMSLGFSIDHPIETLVSYESEAVQKVYWTDGKNQPRVINIEGNIRKANNTQFDFVPTLQLQETVYVKKLLGAGGTFAPGVIQYALTYYTKNGQESNIFYVSPLMYISFRERGASPEDKVENAFRITVNRVDENFDYLRIYSIQRTSINGTPICKRIQDVAIEGLSAGSDGYKKASYMDTGTSGEAIDPTELLYKGGEQICAATMEQKDNTLFLGNIQITRPQLTAGMKQEILQTVSVSQDRRLITATSVSTGSYVYANQLTSVVSQNNNKTVPCGGFKYGDYYRLGVQLQYKTGQWSEPIYIKDEQINKRPAINNDNSVISLPMLHGQIPAGMATALSGKGYMRIRGVVVFPQPQDRNVICQGVVNPTLFTNTQRNEGSLYAQSSWFFRANSNNGNGHVENNHKTVSPVSIGFLKYTNKDVEHYYPYDGTGPEVASLDDQIRKVEIPGQFDDDNKFVVDRTSMVTFHCPDIEFDTQIAATDFPNTRFRQCGAATFTGTMSDINLLTETPTTSNLGSGFVHKSFTKTGSYGIVSGLFYDDYAVDDNDDKIETWSWEKSTIKWLVYLWNQTGSLNNDINRPADKGIRTSDLRKKVISNLRYANTDYSQLSSDTSKPFAACPHLFASNEVAIVKLDSNIYKGNIDTVLIPDEADGNYFCFKSNKFQNQKNIKTEFTSNYWWKTYSTNPLEADKAYVYRYIAGRGKWNIEDDEEGSPLGDVHLDLVIHRNPIRMKYKSTPHLVFEQNMSYPIDWGNINHSLPIVEIVRETSEETRFGGKSNDAFRENVWLPCGEPVLLTNIDQSTGYVHFDWEYGDTYFQRWDCLKTYAFTQEDINQVVEIGSFMLETRVNLDGRYDRNRGQMNNLNMSPQNFNLMNMVYSQVDNFFNYRIQDDSFYKDTVFPNQVTWSKTKTSGADVDLWTNMTLASTLEMDGDKGDITSIQRFNSQLICFQESGISRILYNENYAVSTQDGTPIEIGNSGKVQGKIYLSDTVGCANKWSIGSGTNGLYFMDSDGKEIYMFNGQLINLTTQLGFNTWCKLHIPSGNLKWTPIFPLLDTSSAFITYFDRANQEMLFINHTHCLAFSEKFGVFTSFYDYDNTPYFCNLDDTGIWLRSNQLWKHQSDSRYCYFFGASHPYSMVLVGNPEPQMNKIFTNLEFRACVDGDGVGDSSSFTPYLPFDSLDTWNEYQHGIAWLSNITGRSAMIHHTRDNEASLKRKFRIWRCDIPRDNGDNLDTFDETFDDTFHPIARLQKHPMDRMSNPWLYLRLRKDEEDSSKRVEIHDIVMTYFD